MTRANQASDSDQFPLSDEIPVDAVAPQSSIDALHAGAARETSSSGHTGARPSLAVLQAQERLCERLGHVFRQPSLLDFALTHASWRSEDATTAMDNQRLEFLGDRVLGLAIAELLLHAVRAGPEGQLAALHQEMVRERTLAAVAADLGIGDALRLGRGDEARGARSQPSVIADALEAVLGAVFLDAGYLQARTLTMRLFAGRVDQAVARLRSGTASPAEAFAAAENYKTALQLQLNQLRVPLPTYTVLAETGPAHAVRFRVQVAALVGNRTWVALGEGTSKRAAENMAAQRLLHDLAAPGAR